MPQPSSERPGPDGPLLGLLRQLPLSVGAFPARSSPEVLEMDVPPTEDGEDLVGQCLHL